MPGRGREPEGRRRGLDAGGERGEDRHRHRVDADVARCEPGDLRPKRSGAPLREKALRASGLRNERETRPARPARQRRCGARSVPYILCNRHALQRMRAPTVTSRPCHQRMRAPTVRMLQMHSLAKDGSVGARAWRWTAAQCSLLMAVLGHAGGMCHARKNPRSAQSCAQWPRASARRPHAAGWLLPEPRSSLRPFPAHPRHPYARHGALDTRTR